MLSCVLLMQNGAMDNEWTASCDTILMWWQCNWNIRLQRSIWLCWRSVFLGQYSCTKQKEGCGKCWSQCPDDGQQRCVGWSKHCWYHCTPKNVSMFMNLRAGARKFDKQQIYWNHPVTTVLKKALREWVPACSNLTLTATAKLVEQCNSWTSPGSWYKRWRNIMV